MATFKFADIDSDKQVQKLLYTMFVDHWGEKPVKYEFEKDIMKQTVVIGGTMPDGSIKTLDVTYDFIMDKANWAGMKFQKAKSPFKSKPGTQPMDIFARAAFGCPTQQEFHFSIGNNGKLMTSLYSGTCGRCKLNMSMGLTIVYGCEDPGSSPAAYHPSCFVLSLADDGGRYLHAMPRTLDEMRWRRRAKGACHGDHLSLGKDPTLPEHHKWRCGCSTAPWNLTKRMRDEKRKQLMVGKYDPPF